MGYQEPDMWKYIRKYLRKKFYWELYTYWTDFNGLKKNIDIHYVVYMQGMSFIKWNLTLT